MRTCTIHPAHCPCAACRPLMPAERTLRRQNRRFAIMAVLCAAILALLLL